MLLSTFWAGRCCFRGIRLRGPACVQTRCARSKSTGERFQALNTVPRGSVDQARASWLGAVLRLKNLPLLSDFCRTARSRRLRHFCTNLPHERASQHHRGREGNRPVGQVCTEAQLPDLEKCSGNWRNSCRRARGTEEARGP